MGSGSSRSTRPELRNDRDPAIHVVSFVVDFLVFSRSTPVAAAADDANELNEQHWTYMDGFADGMTARGPTLGTDRQSWTGSLHVVDLPDPEAAREFVAREPYNQAGLFEEHLTWRFINVLGQTMWQFAGVEDEPRFLVLAHSDTDLPQDLSPVPLADLRPELRERLILYGELRNLADDRPVGVALAVQAPTREALDALLGQARAGHARFNDVEIHDWEFGGRR
jgi:uncharacterized protein YciI